jgi:3-oxoacyl-[acyl-carrier protein] reductase
MSVPDRAAGNAVSSFGLHGKVAWLNGASGAIGRAIAAALAREGATVVLSARAQAPLEALAAELEAAHACRAQALAVDLTDRAPVDAAAERIVAEHGRIDLLVNSTSISRFGDFLELDDADWLDVYQSKFFGYLRAIRAVVPQMVRQHDGRIVNVSGRGGHQPTLPVHLPGMSANAAVDLLTKGLANMYGASGIRINAVAPGPVASPRYDTITETNRRLATSASHPTGSAFNTAPTLAPKAQPDEIADVVLFLLSDRSRLMTGTILQADGGSTASL